MKKNNILLLIICMIALLPSCSKDFLEQPPVGKLSEFNINNKLGVQKALIGAYSNLNGRGVNYACPQQSPQCGVHSGEVLKGSSATDQQFLLEFAEYNITGGNRAVEDLWKVYFDGIDKCNITLKMLSIVDELTPLEKTQIEAEARFLRGHYYFYLKRAFKNIPWIDETVEDVRVPNTDESGNYVNVWPQITEDFDFARKNLPETQTDLGRPNKWAADCYYAKVLMTRASEGEYPNGWGEALTIFNDVMVNGVTAAGEKYDLLPYYYWNFSAAHENGPETVWDIQHSTNDGSTYVTRRGGGINGMQEALFLSTTGNKEGPQGWGSGFGFFQPSFWCANHFRVDEDGLPFLDMFETNPHRLKTDDGLTSADAFTPDIVPVDPRLDWSIGRRGIPYLDYGIHPGASWIRSQVDFGPYNQKKWFIKKSENGVYCFQNVAYNSINYHVIRYADVLLLAAECAAHEGELDNAREWVNQVRNRMVENSDNPENWVKLDDGVTNAANYKIGLYPTGGISDPFQTQEGALDAILYERALELAFEGHRFYDVVRFGKGVEEFNAIIASEQDRFQNLVGKEYTEIPDKYFPIPTNAIDLSQKAGVPTLKQNPGY